MQANVVTFEEEEQPTRPINDGPALLKIRSLARTARARLHLAPDIAAAEDAFADLERLAEAALVNGGAR